MKSFYYNSLSDKEIFLYNELILGFKNLNESIEVDFEENTNDFNSENIYLIFQDIKDSFPELYYLNNYSVEIYWFQIKFFPEYIYNDLQIIELNRYLEIISDKIISSIKAEQSDYEKAIILHDYLKENIEYDYEALNSDCKTGFENSYTIIGALIKNKCVCLGFSLAMKFLCNKIDLDCQIITGLVDSSKTQYKGLHAWNIIYMDGYYHHVDVTWDNQYADDSEIPNYAYFGLDDKTISADHTWDRKSYPEITENPYNYFIINKCLITSKSQLEKFILDNLKNKKISFLFKVKEGTLSDSEIPECLENTIFSSTNNYQAESYNTIWIPTQMIYLIKIEYK